MQILRSFQGLIKYYGKFIPNAATIVAPVNVLLHKDAVWNWSEECQHGFSKAKKMLASLDVLMHYNPVLSLWLAGDAFVYIVLGQ